jgi:alanine racemase
MSDAMTTSSSASSWISAPPAPRAEAVIDLDAISANVEAIRSFAGGRDLMAVVKADGYGHGIVEAGRAARAGGATWLGVAFLGEALRLRAAGDKRPILAWLAAPGEEYDDVIASGVEVAAYTPEQIQNIAAAAARVGRPAAVQLKMDSGLARGGAFGDDWERLVDEAVRHRDSRNLDVTGVFSHLACADEVDHPANAAQLETYETGLGLAIEAGLEPAHLHLANSAGTLAHHDTWFTMVRPGIAIYGLSPFADGNSPVPLQPAMTLQAEAALVKRVPAGQGVSYGHTYTTKQETTVVLVPLGYGDGVPRHASNVGPVCIGGDRFTVSGRVCMDQFVVDVGDVEVRAGDEVVLWGDPARGHPTAHEWAEAIGTISYEIVTRVGPRVPRRYFGEAGR